jgi:hypothetical protein
MDELSIDELPIPASLDAPEADDFRATVEVRNASEREGYGTDDFAYSAEELLPGWQNVEHEPDSSWPARAPRRCAPFAQPYRVGVGPDDIPCRRTAAACAA